MAIFVLINARANGNIFRIKKSHNSLRYVFLKQAVTYYTNFLSLIMWMWSWRRGYNNRLNLKSQKPLFYHAIFRIIFIRIKELLISMKHDQNDYIMINHSQATFCRNYNESDAACCSVATLHLTCIIACRTAEYIN